jgi:D-alanine-D-alanine ligase
MKILVLGGGNSSERPVSLRSAAAVAETLAELGYDVSRCDPKDGDAALRQALAQADLVFPILHGAGGEDGAIQAIIEQTKKPYLGSGVAASQLCFDKAAYKKLLQQHLIATPEGQMVDLAGFQNSPLSQRPYVLKPVSGGSSIDTFIVRDPATADQTAIAQAFERYTQLLLEELVEGVEITVPVLGVDALPVVEIVPPDGQEFDYENKYNGATSELCPPRNVTEADQAAAQHLAKAIHQATGCRHLSRTDMIITPGHEIYVLETNTLPGMTGQSLFPRAAAVSGLDWPQLVARFVELASAKTPAVS